jgi:ABC-2 type transport system permease protein
MPLAFLPDWLERIASMLPFAYMIYFPVIAFEGKLTLIELLQILGVQCVWIGVFFFVYKALWRAGLKKYTAVGQ